MIITLKNGNVETDIESVGARINALRVNGVDIVLGFDSVEDYVKLRGRDDRQGCQQNSKG